MRANKTVPKAKKTIIFSDDFYSDRIDEGMIFAKIVRSPFSSGKITSIGFEPGTILPENYFLLTADDIPGQKNIVFLGTRMEIFCSSEIKYKGEPVALLAGPNKKVLKNLLEKIQISLNPKDLIEAEKQFQETYTNLSVSPYDGKMIQNDFSDKSDEIKENQKEISSLKKREIIAKRDVCCGDAEKEFENSGNKIIEGIWKNSVSQHEIKETSGCFCFFRSGNLHIFTPGRFITHLKDSINRVTGVDQENIILTCTKKNGQNSNKIWMNSIFASMSALAAQKSGKAVMLCLSRDEEINFIENPVQIKASYKTAVSKDGILKAMRIKIEADTGFNNPFAREMLDRFIIAAPGIYNTENLKIKVEIFSSNTPPSSIRLNRIDSQIFFAVENQIQKICEKTGISPLEIRIKNLKKQKITKAKPRTDKNPFIAELGRAEDSMKAVCARSDFNRKYTSYRLDEKGRAETDENSPYAPPLRGIGLASAFDGSGYMGTTLRTSRFSLQVTLTEEKKLFVHTAPPSQNIKEIWQKMILDTIGEDFDLDKRSIYFNLDLASADEKGIALVQNDLMIGNISIKTHLLKNCLAAIKNKKNLELPITIKKSISPTRKKQWDEDSFSGIPFFSTSFGTCVVEVEYDSRTYSEKVTGVYAVIDCGKIENPEAAEASAKQAIKKCLSTLVDGDNLNVQNIVVQFAQSDDEPKNLDSLIYSILPAAFCSATSQAAALCINFLPLRTESLFEIKNAGEKFKMEISENSKSKNDKNQTQGKNKDGGETE